MLSEEEQIEALKRWWKDNGTSTVVAITVFVAGFFGWNYYKDAKIVSAQAASVQFQSLTESVQSLDGAQALGSEAADSDDLGVKQATVQSAVNTLIDEHSSGLYTDFARLQLAKLALEQKHYDEAIVTLRQVKDGGVNEESRQLASLRLARVLAVQGNYDEALSEVRSVAPDGAYHSLFEEAKGDILMMQQKLDAAAKAYQAALAALPEGDQRRRSLVQFKIDNTKVATDDDEPSPEESVIDPHGNSDVAGDA